MRWCAAGLLAVLLALASCGPPFVATEGLTYTVQPGDTLYAIAWRLDLDYRDLARWNGLRGNYRIAVGQVLKVSPDGAVKGRVAKTSAPAAPIRAATPPVAASKISWEWPAQGEVVGPVPQPTGGFGLRVLGKLGDPVRAAASGRVVYSGTALKNYGHLIIVKHDDNWLSAYGHNESVLVTEGQQVSKGQPIAAMGPGPNQRPALYFEIRLNGKSVDPSTCLPHRRS